jgi:DNA topoisomerase IB
MAFFSFLLCGLFSIAPMIPALQSITAFFSRPKVASVAPMPSPSADEEIRALSKQVKAHRKDRKKLQLRNRLARERSLLIKLENYGVPIERQFDRQQSQIQRHSPKSLTVHEPAYATDPATGYPFLQTTEAWDVKPGNKHRTRFEQDPLFGWGVNQFAFGFDRLGDLSTNVPTGSFPRELFPERPTTLRTQIAQDAMRFQSRAWFETHPQYAGACGHLVNYTIGTGLTFDVVSDVDKQLAQDVMDYLTEFAKYRWNNLAKRPRQTALNILRDGEDALRIVPSDGEYPEIRVIDTSWIRGPHNEITGPWSMGVLTSWPKCYDDVRAYNVWYPDNTQENISPFTMSLAKAATIGSNVKRGIPLSYKIRKQLPQISNLVDCMAIGEAARQSIPYIQQYNLADKSAVGAALRANESNAAPPELYGDGYGYGMGYGAWDRDGIRPGEVRHINKGQIFEGPPDAPGFAVSGPAVYRTLCESCACATNTPIWFWTGSADAENYSSSLVSESPVVKEIQTLQDEVTVHYKFLLTAAVMIGASEGRFPANVLQIVQVHVTLPTPVARNRKDEVETDLKLLDKRLLAPQQVCKRNDIDFQEAQELIDQAEADGWTNQMGVTQGERPAGQEGPEGEEPAKTGNEPKRLEQLSDRLDAALARFETWEESKHPRGQPDNPGQFGSSGEGASESENAKTKESGSEPMKRPAQAKGESTAAKREGAGKNAKVLLADGSEAPAHITPAMIPPAWKDVQVFTDPDSEIYVKAKDAKGQSKTVYKPSYEASQQAAKYVRIKMMLAEGAEISDQIQSARKQEKFRDVADCAWLINEQATRPGSEADTNGLAEHYGKAMSAENVIITPAKGKGPAKVALKFGDKIIPVKDSGTAAEIRRRMDAGESLEDSTFWLKSHGATTLEDRHVVQTEEGTRLQFVGKEGVWHDHLIGDPKLAEMLTERAKKGGKLFGVSNSQLSSFTKSLDHGRFSPKDFRTKRANELAVAEIKKIGEDAPTSDEERKSRIRKVAEVVSDKLGNRWQQAVESYINPAVWSVWGGA